MKASCKTCGVAVVLLLATGCVATNATLMGPVASKPTATVRPVDIVMYTSADRVQGKYEEIAILHSSGESAYSDETQMYDSMKAKAAALGANAIILGEIREPSAGAKVAAALFMPLGTGAVRTGKAIAIRVDSDEFRARQSESFAMQTMADMNAIASALVSRFVSSGKYPAGATLAEVRAKLGRDAAKRLPLVDRWGTPFRFEVMPNGYRIVSAGSDRVFGEQAGAAGVVDDVTADAAVVIIGASASFTSEWKR